MGNKQREIKFEILRIVAMAMIISLHYLSKGGFLLDLTGNMPVAGYLAWLIEAFCLVAVNVYVLISGYFGCKSEWKVKKLIFLWLQVIFYALIVGIALLVLGLGNTASFNLYEAVKLIFPVITEHYWFATSYILLFVLMPFLNTGLIKLSKKELQIILAVLLVFHSVMKSVLPLHLPWDKLGYDAWWFITLYLTGAYIRIYDIAIMKKKIYCLIVYLASTLLLFGMTLGLREISIRTGKLSDFVGYGYAYNHILCFIASVGLLGIFKQAKLSMNNPKMNSFVMKLSRSTFGVYLLHEHILIRYQWPVWLGAKAFNGSVLFVAHMLLSVIIVFMVGALVELLRQRVFSVFAKNR